MLLSKHQFFHNFTIDKINLEIKVETHRKFLTCLTAIKFFYTFRLTSDNNSLLFLHKKTRIYPVRHSAPKIITIFCVSFVFQNLRSYHFPSKKTISNKFPCTIFSLLSFLIPFS